MLIEFTSTFAGTISFEFISDGRETEATLLRIPNRTRSSAISQLISLVMTASQVGSLKTSFSTLDTDRPSMWAELCEKRQEET